MVVALSTLHRKEHTTMIRRTALKYTLTAALAAAAVAGTPALAMPIDGPIDGSSRYESAPATPTSHTRDASQTGSLAGTTEEMFKKQDLRGEQAKDAAVQAAKDAKLAPGQPVFPTYHEPLPPRALNISAPATNDDGSDVGIWLLLLSGLAGAGIAGGGAAGLVRHSRLRARRVAA
jgi:hypothetical protein